MSRELLESHLKSLTDSNSPETCAVSFQCFRKLLSNIVENPSEQKFTILKLDNAVIEKKLLPCEGILEFAKALGYTEKSPSLMSIKPGDLEQIKVAIELFDQALASLQVPEEATEDPHQEEVQHKTEEIHEEVPPQPKESKFASLDEHDFRLEWSGSFYDGPIQNGWFQGKGRFTFPSGVVYEGQFHKGEFHGKGVLIFPNGGKYIATWERGRMVDGEYEYYDGLMYHSQDWEYCKIPDRRFYTEIKEGLRPAGATLSVNDAKGPRDIPKGTYDTGEGYYDPVAKKKYDYNGKEVLFPEENDIFEIVQKYRYNPNDIQDISDEED